MPREQIVGHTDGDFFDLEKAGDLRRNDREVMETGRGVAREEFDLIKNSGETRYYWTVKQPLLDGNVHIVGIYGISTDISERKQRELDLLEGRILDDRSTNLDLQRDRSRPLRVRSLHDLLPAAAVQTCAAGHCSGASFKRHAAAAKPCFPLSVPRQAAPPGHQLEVEDTGIGIDPEGTPRPFASFEQGDNSLRRAHGGSGPGLAITRGLTRLMNGDAGATSTPDVGSTFCFTARPDKVVIATATPVAACDDVGAAIAREQAGSRLLVVEDEPFNREIAWCLLEDVALRWLGQPQA